MGLVMNRLVVRVIFRVILWGLFIGGLAMVGLGRCFAQNGAQNNHQNLKSNRATAFELLTCWQDYGGDQGPGIGGESGSLQFRVDPKYLELFVRASVEAREKKFGELYQRNRARHTDMLKSFELAKKKKENSETLAFMRQTEGQQRQLLQALCREIHISFFELLNNVDPHLKKRLEARHNRPRMPGVFGGTREERMLMAEDEKLELTPVDDEFSKTQLGKKIESDTGSQVEAWSYDPKKNALYIRPAGDKDEMVKVQVKVEGNERILQTRGGKKMIDPMGRDTPMDLTRSDAAGSFFQTGQNTSVFGKRTKEQPKSLPDGHFYGDGHDHAHDGHNH